MKNELPYDIARCRPFSNVCSDKKTCVRFTSKSYSYRRQVMMDGSIGIIDTRCDMFISNEVKR